LSYVSDTCRMNRPLFVSLDGPKGTGKTTLLEAITQVLRAGNNKVIRLSERNNDPNRGKTHGLGQPTRQKPLPGAGVGGL